MASFAPDDPSDVAGRRTFAWVSTTLVLVLSICSYFMRLWARRLSGQRLKADDYLMAVGLLLSLIPAISEYVLLANGLGHHIWNVSKKEKYHFARATFALQRANQPSLVCIKLSILFCYMRLFPIQKLHRLAYINMAYTICWGIATWIVNLNVCTPIAYAYDRTIVGGHCKNQAISGTVSGALSLLGDVMILILPIPVLLRLRINMRRKLALCGIFLLGAIVCVSSAVRIKAIIKFVATDATYTQVYAGCWTYMEMGIAVISGNLPLLRPLFEPFFRNKGQITYASESSYPARSRRKSYANDGGMEGGFERIQEDTVSRSESQTELVVMGKKDIRVTMNYDVSTETARCGSGPSTVMATEGTENKEIQL